jgi:hypothetical protein
VQTSRDAASSAALCTRCGFSRLFVFTDAAIINGMFWFEILVRPIVDWLFELPSDFVGRKLDELFGRIPLRTRRRRASRRRALRGRRKQAKSSR